jgi:hypothetical protein
MPLWHPGNAAFIPGNNRKEYAPGTGGVFFFEISDKIYRKSIDSRLFCDKLLILELFAFFGKE